MSRMKKTLTASPESASEEQDTQGGKTTEARGSLLPTGAAFSEHELQAIYSSTEATVSDDFALDISIGYQVRTAHRALQRYLQTKIGPYDVTLGMWYFLRALWQQDGVTQSDLSRSIGTMEPTTMSAIAYMERNGLVRRERDQADKRRQLVFLTAKGKALRKQLVPRAASVVQDATQGMTLREIAMLLQLLKQIQSNLLAKLENPDFEIQDFDQ